MKSSILFALLVAGTIVCAQEAVDEDLASVATAKFLPPPVLAPLCPTSKLVLYDR